MAWKDMAYILKGLEMIGGLTETGMNIYDRVQTGRDNRALADYQRTFGGVTPGSLEDLTNLQEQAKHGMQAFEKRPAAAVKAQEWLTTNLSGHKQRLAQQELLAALSQSQLHAGNKEQHLYSIGAKYGLTPEQTNALMDQARTSATDNNANKQFLTDAYGNMANRNLTPEQIMLANAVAGRDNSAVQAGTITETNKGQFDQLKEVGTGRTQQKIGGATVLTDYNRLGTPVETTKVTIGDQQHAPRAVNVFGGGDYKPNMLATIREAATQNGNVFYAMAQDMGANLDSLSTLFDETTGQFKTSAFMAQLPKEMKWIGERMMEANAEAERLVLQGMPPYQASEAARRKVLADAPKKDGGGKGGGGKGGGRERRSLDEIMK